MVDDSIRTKSSMELPAKAKTGSILGKLRDGRELTSQKIRKIMWCVRSLLFTEISDHFPW